MRERQELDIPLQATLNSDLIQETVCTEKDWLCLETFLKAP